MTIAQSKVYDKIISGKRGKIVGPLRAALHSPKLADRWQALGEFLRFETSLPAHISELAIICAGRYWNCQLEWAIHSGIAEEAGLTDEVIESIREAQAPDFDDHLQGAVYDFSRELLEYGQVSDAVYHELLGLIDVAALVELTAVIGYYSMVALMLNVHQVPLPENENGSLLDLPDDSELRVPTRLACRASKRKAPSGTKR
jgi:4-carboxymuconolactone decarboxylase